MNPADEALVALGQYLKADAYQFVTPSISTQSRMLARRDGFDARSLRDIFGWSMPFQREQLPHEVLACLEQARMLEALEEGRFRSRVRFATVGDQIFLHSVFPTRSGDPRDAVTFGPDVYRLVRFIQAHAVIGAERAVDVSAGAGAGGLCLAGRVRELLLTELNPTGRWTCAVNAELNAVAAVQVLESGLLEKVPGLLDLAVMNAPYLMSQRGGGPEGLALAVEFVKQGLQRLSPGGQLILHTGAPIRDGRDLLWESLEPLLPTHGPPPVYETLEVDVGGEELELPIYENVERIAAVGLALQLAV